MTIDIHTTIVINTNIIETSTGSNVGITRICIISLLNIVCVEQN